MYITCQDIEKSTGLEYHYILKAVKLLDNVFTKDIVRRGNNNSLLFSSESAYTIFDKIKQLKDQRISLRQMKKDFDFENKNNLSKQSLKKIESNYNMSKTKTIESSLLEKIEELNTRNNSVINDLIVTKDLLIKELENRINHFLPAGKSEQDILNQSNQIIILETEVRFLKEYKEKIEKIKPLIKQLYDLENSILNFTSSNQRKNLLLEIFKILM